MWESLTWFAQSPWLPLATIVGVLVAIWRFTRCPHPAPHGFIPPTVDQSGRIVRDARWFCRSCGQHWPAEMAYERRAVRSNRR